jgi:hypothetical protein
MYRKLGLHTYELKEEVEQSGEIMDDMSSEIDDKEAYSSCSARVNGISRGKLRDQSKLGLM